MASDATVAALAEVIATLPGPLNAGIPEDRHRGPDGHRFLAGCPLCVGDPETIARAVLASDVIADLIAEAKRDVLGNAGAAISRHARRLGPDVGHHRPGLFVAVGIIDEHRAWIGGAS